MMAILVIVVILIGFSIFLNGWTDAPNSIATVITTRVLKPRAAVLLAMFFNMLGVFALGSAVSSTTASIVTIGTGTSALISLGAVQLSVIVWNVTTWKYGIPASESHSLIAGLVGAGISLNGINAFNISAFNKVLVGLLISSFLGFTTGLLTTKFIEFSCRNLKRQTANNFFSFGQIFSASLMSLSHGSQDGQKFMGVLYLALVVGGVYSDKGTANFQIPIWILIFSSLLISLGTSVGGYRIIKKMGQEMVRLEKYQGFASELAASGIMIVSTFLGIPLGTTSTKTASMMGAGASKGISNVKWSVAKDLILAWILTFPICTALGYIFATVFRMILHSFI